MRRIRILRAVFLGALLILSGRLYYIQIICGEELAEGAYSQHEIPVIQEQNRGKIYDRHMEALTDTSRAYYYLIHKDYLTKGAKRQLSRMEAEPAGKKGEDYLVFRTENYSPSASMVLQKQWNAYGFCVDVRHGEKQTAGPLIVDLETMYGPFLDGNKADFCFLGNGAGELLAGTGMTVKTAPEGSGRPAGLITTIDLQLQQEIEAIFVAEGITGCAVVTDTENGQVLAMISRSGSVDCDETTPNLSVEQAYPLGKIYTLVKKAAVFFEIKPSEAASMLGLGVPVFAGYPGEDAGTNAEDGYKATATAAQVSQLLVTLANQGVEVPLTLVMRTAQEESMPCMAVTETGAEALQKMKVQLAKKPLVGNGWTAGYISAEAGYAVAVHVEEGNAQELYQRIMATVTEATL